ncbi:MAG: Rrf2 family transcriptional regulator [Actinobacteria bacterium]|nr:Rrf2 family transcriptional regulator [Actinomycetota bacterium]MCB9388935.1 Rrf2 family transcriptional regulator [Acidimicrobiia bacterium]
MKVSTRGDYATRALVSMALHDPQIPTSVKEIAERTGLPQPYLEQILLAIKGAGLVRSKRGVGGGYVLARDPAEISVADVLAAVDGPIASDVDEIEHSEGRCVIQDIWIEVFERMRDYLNAVTLATLVQRATVGHDGVHTGDPRPSDPLG